jgi:iron-sulfur cluster assembly protein
MIKVSETAKSKVLQLMQEDGFDPSKDYVRVGVKSGGCSGLSYDLKFDKSQIKGDKLFEDNGVKIIVDTKSFLYLIGTTLEYSGGLNGEGLYLITLMLIVLAGVENLFHYNIILLAV